MSELSCCGHTAMQSIQPSVQQLITNQVDSRRRMIK